jgi:hypothetical protein
VIELLIEPFTNISPDGRAVGWLARFQLLHVVSYSAEVSDLCERQAAQFYWQWRADLAVVLSGGRETGCSRAGNGA